MSAILPTPAHAEIVYLPPSALSSYERNAQIHSEYQIDKIAASIREFGFNQPILIGEDKQIIAGHGRLLAANKLALKLVPCIVLGHLSPERRRAYIIADNQMSRLAGVDEEILARELAELQNYDFGFEAIGYEEDEVLKLLEDAGLDSSDVDNSIPNIVKKETIPNPMPNALMPYFGGKFRMAQQIIEHFPPHRVYVECFGGAGSVLLNKEPAECEIYNDLNSDLVNIFEVLRNNPSELIRGLKRTAYSEDELRLSLEKVDDKIEMARRTLVRAHMVFHPTQLFGDYVNFRVYRGEHKNAATTFNNFVRGLPYFIRRVKNISISNTTAVKIMERMDGPDTLHYVDPPYVGDTRKSSGTYEFEMLSNNLHQDLLTCLLNLRGVVVLSGYANELYDTVLGDWRRVVIPVRVFNTSGGISTAEEVLWINR